MILDLLPNWSAYQWPSERFRQGFQYLESLDPNTKDGKYLIQGEDVFCLMQTFETSPQETREFEAHREYADIQYVMSGEETILWSPQNKLTVTKPYTHDIEFYALVPSATSLLLTPGTFGVFYPRDAHAPCIVHEKPCTVRKAVIKVKVK